MWKMSYVAMLLSLVKKTLIVETSLDRITVTTNNPQQQNNTRHIGHSKLQIVRMPLSIEILNGEVIACVERCCARRHRHSEV